MSQGFTTYWRADFCSNLARQGLVGRPIPMAFGGPHQSAPRLSSFGVGPGDHVYPVQVRGGALYVLAQFEVAQLFSPRAYAEAHPVSFVGIDPTAGASPGTLELYRRRPDILDWQRLDLWIKAHPELGVWNPGEADEIVTVRASSPLRLDCVISADVVPQLRWQAGRRPPRGLRHLDSAGRITRTVGLQGGIYRLTPESVVLLDAAMSGRAG